MLKYASAQVMTATLVPNDLRGRELKRFAHRHHFEYDVRPGYLYVRSRAISSRCNDNFDEFPAEELEKAYATFKGKPVFVNHVNDDHRRARGVIIDAALHKDSNRDGTRDYWVEVLMEVDAVRFPKLAKEILAGNIARTSMGCDVAFSVCSACNNRATTPAEYCSHIPGSKGMMLYRRTASGHKVGEIIRETCYGLKFFENSLLVEPPADPTAHFLGVDTRGLQTAASRRQEPAPRPDVDPRTAKLLTDLFRTAAEAQSPAEHPWFADTGIHHSHIVNHWEQSTPEEKAQGARWYPDAHLVAKQIAKLDPRITDEKEAAHKGAGVLSAYSPQQNWWANQHNAARSFHEQRALGKGEGLFIMGSHQRAAQRIMDGEDSQTVLKGPKTADFAHLIEHGGYKPQSDEDAAAGKPREHSDKVVVDRHALSVAAGKRLNADDVKGFKSQSRPHYEHVAGEYRKAAAVISDREGREVPPHEVQAVTWLTRQRLNKDEEISTPSGKGRQTMQQNQRRQWQELSRQHTPDLHEDPVNSHVAPDPEPKQAQGSVVPPFGGEPVTALHRTASLKAQASDVGGYRINHASPSADSGVPYHQVSGQHGPNDMVDIFRAVPRHVDRINQGDWVTLRGDWAQDRADSAQNFHVLQSRVPAKHVFVDRTSRDIDEAGYHGPHMTGPSVRPRGGKAPDQPRLFEGRKKLAYGEQKAPMDVDTLREDACPVCGDRDTFDGAQCQVCSYVAPPKMFQDPDLEKARQLDLRKDITDFQDPANPNQVGPDGQPLDQTAQDPSMQPGGLPGEVQAEVQPDDGSPVDPAQMGQEGQIPDEMGAPVDPSLIGPDGQPLQQPGGQMMVGPDGMPIGPQALPADATTNMGQPFTPGPNMPEGPGDPEGPEGPAGVEELDQDGQPLNPDAGQGAPGTPGDGVPDLMCPSCGFTSDATQPTSVDMDTQTLPNTGVAMQDGVQAGDICPNCQSAQLLSPAQAQGAVPVPMPV